MCNPQRRSFDILATHLDAEDQHNHQHCTYHPDKAKQEVVEGFGEKRLGLADFFKNWGFSLGLHNTNSISDPPLPAESFQPLTVLLFPQDELAGTARYSFELVRKQEFDTGFPLGLLWLLSARGFVRTGAR